MVIYKSDPLVYIVLYMYTATEISLAGLKQPFRFCSAYFLTGNYRSHKGIMLGK